ncbi:MAG: SLBB domain-containing protein, partial [Muribaculaceae bacterium]|nr:SLBB domain-containing protein [Muribaculaceae bacterium]
RTIQVNVMGEVSVPGTYRLSPFATVFNALYRAGGINSIGTMRNVQVMRNGRRLANVDVYEYLFGGKDAGNIRLEEGDVIIVPPYQTLINIEGNVKRPMLYEINSKETLDDLIKYAGGFTGDAYSDMVRLSRQTGHENELYNIKSEDFASYKLKDGDVITVGTIVDRYANRVQLRGQVMRPGTYALGDGVETVTQLINKAEGLLDNAYTDRVLIYREGPDLTLQVLPIDLGAVLSGTAPDIRLQRNDIIEIANLQELLDRGGFTIQGEVASPGIFPYAENTTVEDLILQAGGLLQGASTARIEVSRRIIDPASLHTSNRTAETFTLTYNGGRVGDESSKFVLQPYDIVEVRKSPVYMAQQRVAVGGEVTFGGAYTIANRNERLSNLIQRAGGLTDAAYIRGAHLSRRMTEDEIEARNEALRLARMMQDSEQTDSISLMKMELRNRYNVGIELDKALANPGCDEDLVLADGDVLFIPQLVNTVKIQGDVMYPNTVVYQKGKKLKHYIEQAGGYGSMAKKSKAYIVYLNGTVAKAKRNTPIEPGCQIIVPSKSPGKGVDWQAVLSIGTSAGALGTMAASIAALLK